MNSLRRPRAFAGAALFALVLFQVAIAAHDSQHTIGDFADSCAMCVQLDDGGLLRVDAAPANDRLPAASPLRALLSLTHDRRPADSLRTRAPPQR